MDIKFKNIIIDNFLSFGHAELNLEDKGLCLIKGVNNSVEDNALSNGSGKSTLFNALSYALTGETIQGLSSNLNNIFTNGDMSVTLNFTVDEDDFLITRSRTTNGKADLKICVNGEDKSGKGVRESESLLEQYLPELTSDLIGELILIGQGMPHKFSDNSPSGRKELLEKLTHSDFVFQEIRDKIVDRSNELKNEQSKLICLLQVEEMLVKSTQDNINKETEKLNNLNNIDELDKSIEKYTEEIDELDSKVKDFKNKIDLATNNLDEFNDTLTSIMNKENEEIDKETEEFNKANSSIKTSLIESKVKLNSLNIEIEKLSNIKDVCPTCGQKLPYVHKPDISKQLEEKSLLEKQLEELDDKNNSQTEAYNLNIKDIKDNYNHQIIECKDNINKIKDNLTIYKNELNKNETLLKTKEAEKANLIKEKYSFEVTKNNYIQNIENLTKKLEEAETKVNNTFKDLDVVGNHITVIDKISTIVKRDFRGVLLSDIIYYIDSKLKQYSLQVFGTDKISFELNGNNIDITYLNKPLELLSGGEQQKLNLLLQFAIRSMVQEYMGFNSNILVLDEILDNLDAKGCDEILNFISDIDTISSIFIISHHADSLNIGNDSIVTVIKNNSGVSSIV